MPCCGPATALLHGLCSADASGGAATGPTFGPLRGPGNVDEPRLPLHPTLDASHCLQAKHPPHGVKTITIYLLRTRPAAKIISAAAAGAFSRATKLTRGQAAERKQACRSHSETNMATEASKKEAFRQYLEQAGVLDTMTKSRCCLCLAGLSDNGTDSVCYRCSPCKLVRGGGEAAECH